MSITKASLIDLNGQELILDADADTSITADTDDQIDIKIAGSDKIHIVSTGLGINGTSTINADLHLGAASPHIDIGPAGGNRGKVGFDSNNVFIGSTSGTGEVILKNNIGSTDGPEASGDELARFGDTIIFNESGNDLDFRVESDNKANMFLVDAGADAVLIGGGASENFLSESHELQVNDTNFSVASFATYRAGSDGATLSIGHSRNGTINSHTVLNDDDTMGLIQFYGSDGTDFARGASIQAAVDGTPGNNDMPGRLVFSTTADGSDSPTERVRINSSGQVGIGTDNPTRLLHIKQDDTTTYAGNSAGTNIALHLANTSTGAAGNTIGIGLSSESNAEVYLNCVTSANNNGGDFVIATRYGGRAEKMRVRGAGGITFNGDTGDANALDDYEEGTWTPTDESGAGLSFTVSHNRYTKIGRIVHAHVLLTFPSTSNTSLAKIGLPFTCSGDSDSSSTGGAVTEQNIDTSKSYTASVNYSDSLVIREFGSTALGNNALSGKNIRFIVTYFTT